MDTSFQSTLVIPILQLIGGAACLAISWALVKTAMHQTSIPQMLFFRSFGGLAMAGVVLGLGHLHMPSRAEWPWVLLAATLAPTLIGLLAFTGMRSGSMAAINALTLTQPMWVLFIDVLIRSISHPPIAWVGAVLVVTGCVVLLRDGRQINAKGLVLGLSSALVWTTATIVQSHVLNNLKFPKESLIAWQNIGYFIFAGSLLSISAAKKRERRFAGWRIVGLALLSGLLVQILFELLKFSALKSVTPFVATSVLLLQLPFAMLLGWVALKERLTWQMTTAAACIMGGAVLAGIH